VQPGPARWTREANESLTAAEINKKLPQSSQHELRDVKTYEQRNSATWSSHRQDGSSRRNDWASEKHDVLIEGPTGEGLLAATFAHDEDEVSGSCPALECFDVEIVAIERPEGLLVDRLLDVGVRVLALHPNQVKAAQDRFRSSGGKSDWFDPFALYELARTDAHRFRILEPDSDETQALRTLTRAREDLVAARVAMANQLRGELERFWPAPVGLFSDLESPISLVFLERFSGPHDARSRRTPASEPGRVTRVVSASI
jgi:Transposase